MDSEPRRHPGTVKPLIEAGMDLMQKTLDLISSWEFDPRTQKFPAIITDKTHPLGDLEIAVTQWFNLVDLATEGFQTGIPLSNSWHFERIIRPFGGLHEQLGRKKVIKSVAHAFDELIRALHCLPEETRITNSSLKSHFAVSPNTAFILMWIDPTRPDLEDVSSCFKDVFGEFGVTATRADDIEHQDVITDVILHHIRNSEFLIADLSGERPNVYYEVGYAHAVGKRPILFRKAGTRLHFDLSVHNVPEYRNMTELRTLLRKRLQAMTGKQSASLC